jgi:hypothetical protein
MTAAYWYALGMVVLINAAPVAIGLFAMWRTERLRRTRGPQAGGVAGV